MAITERAVLHATSKTRMISVENLITILSFLCCVWYLPQPGCYKGEPPRTIRRERELAAHRFNYGLAQRMNEE
jgi:hypothetical protein